MISHAFKFAVSKAGSAKNELKMDIRRFSPDAMPDTLMKPNNRKTKHSLLKSPAYRKGLWMLKKILLI